MSGGRNRKHSKIEITGVFIKGCAGKVQHKSYLSAEFYLTTLHYGTDAGIYECCYWFFSLKKPITIIINKLFD